jgi:DNA repair photolyase
MKIKSIRRIHERTPVHDIQTGTHDFFTERVLVHNCYSDSLLTQPYGGWCAVECAFCLEKTTPVDTPNGQKPIGELKPGDVVWGRDILGLKQSSVVATATRKVDSYYFLQVGGHRFRITGNHPLFVRGRGWTPVEQLEVGDNVETADLQALRGPNTGKGGEGILPTQGQGQAPALPTGVQNRGLERDQTEGIGHSTVEALEEVNEPLIVVDIQTDTENFYADGVLMHNCYINNGTRGYRGSGITVVDPNYPKKVRKQVSQMRTATAFYMSSFIDPFLELEPIYQNTKGTATVALDNGLPMFFLTRKIAPSWVFDYLKANKYSYMQFSLNTPDPVDWRHLSPKAAPLETQFDQVREFHKQGIYISIQVNPIVAGVTSVEQICELIHILAEAGADHLIFKYVEIVTPSRKAVVRQMRNRFGGEHEPHPGKYKYDRAELFNELFSEVIGGMYTITEEYRKAALDRFLIETKKAGVTMALCYEYEYRRDARGQIIDKTGVSMGHKYLTADQCHGHRVPVFTRDIVTQPWREIKGCPPSGCLTCSDQFPKEVPCSNDLLASAPAWEPAMMKLPAKLPAGSQKKEKDGRVSLKLLTTQQDNPGEHGCGGACGH